MRVGLLESYQPRKSPLHGLRAETKLLAALALILAVVAAPRNVLGTMAVLLVGAPLLICAAAASRIPAGWLLRRLLCLEPFVFGVAMLSIWQPNGVSIFWQTVWRSTICLGALILLAATTPFSEIVRVLRRWRVPGLLLTTLTLMDRYLFVLVEESGRMQRARASRTFAPRSKRAAWESLADTLGNLFVRVVGRAERIYAAMCARGWPE
jgi:cobalt/nickel transport system permease protein